MTPNTQAAEAAAYRLTHTQGRNQQDTTGDLFGITAEDAQRERQRREAMAARPPREKDLFAQ
jgi:hypothetical protein